MHLFRNISIWTWHLTPQPPRSDSCSSELTLWPALANSLGRDIMDGTHMKWIFWYSLLLPPLLGSLAHASSLHAVLGIDWDSLKNRASHGDYWLTTSFVPEVLSPVLVRIASVFKDIIRKQWYLEATLIGVVTVLMMMLLTMLLACVYRRHLRRQIKKVPTLVRNLDQRDYMGAAATVLAPWYLRTNHGPPCIWVIMYSSTRIKWDGSHAPPKRLLHHRLFIIPCSLVTVLGTSYPVTTTTNWRDLWGPVTLILMLWGPVSNKIREFRKPWPAPTQMAVVYSVGPVSRGTLP